MILKRKDFMNYAHRRFHLLLLLNASELILSNIIPCFLAVF